MRHRLHCKSSWIIYLITCTRPCDRGLTRSETGESICGRQYCGSTTESMAGRHAGHRTDIKNSSSPLGRHFGQCGIANLSLQIIDTVREGELDALEQLEGHWTHRLSTFQVHGHINVRNEMGKRRNRNQYIQITTTTTTSTTTSTTPTTSSSHQVCLFNSNDYTYHPQTN